MSDFDSNLGFIFRFWQKLAMCVGCPQIVRNLVCTAFVSEGMCEKDRRDLLSVEGFLFPFWAVPKRKEKKQREI